MSDKLPRKKYKWVCKACDKPSRCELFVYDAAYRPTECIMKGYCAKWISQGKLVVFVRPN